MMDQRYKMALTEVNLILENTENELVIKIPHKVLQLIKTNMDREYIPNIDANNPISEQKIMKETEAILSLIFRSYWATEQEKMELEQNDIYSEPKQNIKDAEDIFKHKVKGEKEEKQNTSIAKVNDISWYKKIYRKILKIFHIKNK